MEFIYLIFQGAYYNISSNIIILFYASEVKSPKLYSLPPTKSSRPDLVEKTMFSLGLMTDYEIWEFLRDKPSENVVLDNIGCRTLFGVAIMILQNFYIISLIKSKIITL